MSKGEAILIVAVGVGLMALIALGVMTTLLSRKRNNR
jgi:VIT1/CCC1 family predicted Fe2+/Mn2+ transporter